MSAVNPRAGFAPLRPPRNMTGALVDRLTEEITSGKLKPNEKLPTEQEMIASLGVSRTVVREAIAALRSEGLVESRQGAGVFVAGDRTRRPFRISADRLNTREAVHSVMELRIAIEVEAAALAAERRTEGDLVALDDAIQAYAQAIERGEDAADADYAFHRAMCAATGNEHFLAFIEFLAWHIPPRRHFQGQTNGGRLAKSYLQKVCDEHQEIVDAVRRREKARAARAMRRHLEKGRQRYAKFAYAKGDEAALEATLDPSSSVS